MYQSVFPTNSGFAFQTMCPMFMQPMMPMGPMGQMWQQMGAINPQMQAVPPAALQSMGGMPYGMPLTEEAQQEYTKSCLNNQKEQLLQAKKYLDDYQKFLDQSISAIDSQLSKFSTTEPETKKPGK
jgi:hypothetical protein